ncbi:Hcp family type VI secretion system effector [Aestuariibius insulae]|uniref:Hcp family type VI secretion system effector n=1 Tax=Aestuariibius insulae TaxID=2058287 RepID=UPI00345E82A3
MAVDIFLELSNNIKGESQDATYKDCIDVLAWNAGMTNSGTTHMGGGAGSGKVNVSDLSLTKYVDLASTDLRRKCCDGTHIERAKLIVRKSGGDAPVEYEIWRFETLMTSSYQTGGSKDGLDRIQENLTLNFRRFHTTYTIQDENGVAGASQSYGWDIAENQEWTPGWS